MSPRVRTALILLLLFFAAWLPRVLALDTFVSTDERKWLARSGNFLQAITHGDLADTFQREHPGVTVMMAGSLGFLQKLPDYPALAPGQFTWEAEHIEAWLKQNTTVSPLEMMTAGRWWIVLIVALTIALGFLPLRRLFGDGPAILATLFVAWNPFAIGFSRQLHPDGFVSGFTYLALLLFLAWLYTGQRRRDLITSAFVMGLAWLTKTPAIFLVPTGALLIAIELVRARHTTTSHARWSLVGSYVLWGALATFTFVFLWPSMWVHPFDTLARMAREMGAYVEGHTNVNYFMGQPTADPGLFFYPVAWLFRTTPGVMVGLAAAATYGWRKRRLFDAEVVRRGALALLLFALVFTLGMSIGAKKFDRYILPAFLALDVVAALGWWALGQSVAARMGASGARACTMDSGRGNCRTAGAPRHLCGNPLPLLPHLLQSAHRGKRHRAAGADYRLGRGARRSRGVARSAAQRREAARCRLVQRRPLLVLLQGAGHQSGQRLHACLARHRLRRHLYQPVAAADSLTRSRGLV